MSTITEMPSSTAWVKMRHMESPTRRQYEVGLESRRRVLEAAEKLIAERGFEKTSIVEIAKRAGVSRGSIPWHFENKAGILLAVVEGVTQRELRIDELGEDATAADVFARYAELIRSGGARLMFSVLNEAVTATGSVREQYQEYYATERERIVEWMVLEGAGSAEECEPLAGAILASLLGATLQWLVDPERVDLEALVRALAAMVDDHVGARVSH